MTRLVIVKIADEGKIYLNPYNKEKLSNLVNIGYKQCCFSTTKKIVRIWVKIAREKEKKAEEKTLHR